MARVATLFLLAVVGCGGTKAVRSPGSARSPADEVVRRVQGVYRNTQRLTATFRQHVVNKTFGLPSMNDGKLYVKRPDKMRCDYFSKRDTNRITRTIIWNGTTVWAVDAGGRWYYQQNRSSSLLPVMVTFLTGTDQLARDFDARLLTRSNHGAAGDRIVELIPKKPSAPFRSLTLVVDGSSYRVKKSIVTSASGDSNELSFYELDTTRPVADRWFVFNQAAASARGFRAIKAQTPPPRSPPAHPGP
jgi:outer membrane lipoprotein-sorting protein